MVSDGAMKELAFVGSRPPRALMVAGSQVTGGQRDHRRRGGKCLMGWGRAPTPWDVRASYTGNIGRLRLNTAGFLSAIGADGHAAQKGQGFFVPPNLHPTRNRAS